MMFTDGTLNIGIFLLKMTNLEVQKHPPSVPYLWKPAISRNTTECIDRFLYRSNYRTYHPKYHDND